MRRSIWAELPRNVLFLFQPSEETTGGAGKLCESGVLERYRVRRIFGLHLVARPGGRDHRLPPRPADGTVQRGHRHRRRPQRPHVPGGRGAGRLTAGISYLQRAYDMMEQLPPDQPRVLRFGKMVSGTVRNAISGRTVLEGSLRTYREDTFRFCRQQLKDIGRSVAAETGCSLDVHLSEGYPAVWNHEELYQKIAAQLGDNAPDPHGKAGAGGGGLLLLPAGSSRSVLLPGVGSTPELHAPGLLL